MKIFALIPAVIAALALNAHAFDPVGNANPTSAATQEQAERMEQMMDVWNSMTPEEKAASNAEKHRNDYQANTVNNAEYNKAKEARRLQAERNRAAARQHTSDIVVD